jgi:hypothetical protein
MTNTNQCKGFVVYRQIMLAAHQQIVPALNDERVSISLLADVRNLHRLVRRPPRLRLLEIKRFVVSGRMRYQAHLGLLLRLTRFVHVARPIGLDIAINGIVQTAIAMQEKRAQAQLDG